MNIPGIGAATVTDPTEIVSSVAPVIPEDPAFPLLPYVVIGTLDHPPATDSITGIALAGSNSLLGYDLRTSISAIAGIGGVGYDPCCFIHTTRGNLVFAANLAPTRQATFIAAVPEPSSLLLLGGGAVVLAGYRSRRRSR